MRIIMSPVEPMLVRDLMIKVQRTLSLTQSELARVLGCSRRTIIRYQQGGGVLLPSNYKALATACHSHDRALAEYLAKMAGETLVSLGLERPAPPPPAPPPSQPSPRDMVDSVVCAAAEAMSLAPQTVRAPLTAAFGRAVALGMSAEDVLRALAPVEKTAPGRPRARRR